MIPILCSISIVLTGLCCSNVKADDKENRKREQNRRPAPEEGLRRPEAGPAAMLDQMFSRLDGNGDGQVSQDEFLAPILQRFQRADENRDGSIDREEMMAAREHIAALIRGGTFGMPNDRPMDSSEGRPNDREPSDREVGDRPRNEQRSADDRFRQLMQRIQLDDQGRLALADVPEPMRERLAQLDANADGLVDSSEGGQLLARLQNARSQRDGKPRDGRDKRSREMEPRGGDRQSPQKPKRPADESGENRQSS